MLSQNSDVGLYTIGVVAELLNVHPETLRIWERNHLIEPQRKNKHRLYSNNDVKRLRYIQHLTADKGLNIAGVKEIINLYPCWWLKNCHGGRKSHSVDMVTTKPCWKEDGTYCLAIDDKADFCAECAQYAECKGRPSIP